jgi:hypothetical protein
LHGLVLGQLHLRELRYAVFAPAFAKHDHGWVLEPELVRQLSDPFIDFATEPTVPQLAL